MNSEELEASLRTEFESYLKEIFVEMRQELSQLQEKVSSEIERHKSTLDETFNEFMSRVETDKEIDASFKDSIIEHLRLSRDEGARITAMAIAEAEDMEKESAAASAAVATSSVGIKEIHAAISDISTKNSQSEILKALVHHAANFAPRGAFFIIKNEHLVGWRVFGKDNHPASEEKIREVFLSVSSDSILSTAVKSLETVEGAAGTYADDAEILNKLEFGEPLKMAAIPLVARGRGVAVLYADYETSASEVNIEALEALTRVAGLTVEVLASAKNVTSTKKDFAKKPAEEFTEEYSAPVNPPEYQAEYQPPYRETNETSFEAVSSYQPSVEEPASESSYQISYEVPEPVISPAFEETSVEAEETKEEPVTDNLASDDYPVVEEVPYEIPVEPEEKYPAFEENSWSQPVGDNSWTNPLETTKFSAQEYTETLAKDNDPAEYAKDFSLQPTVESNDSAAPATIEYQFETNNDYQIDAPKEDAFSSYNPSQAELLPATQEEKVSSFETENGKIDQSFAEPLEPVSPSFEPVSPTVENFQPVEPVSPPVTNSALPKSRLSERNVDLPIEVSEDERRLHNDARRFARLLVSEIKLYNEQKVKEGRDASDIYERLREAIDRSREMYDKRVQPPVAAKFDYFHYEIVNTLAEGNENKLGAGYPGAAV